MDTWLWRCRNSGVPCLCVPDMEGAGCVHEISILSLIIILAMKNVIPVLFGYWCWEIEFVAEMQVVLFSHHH